MEKQKNQIHTQTKKHNKKTVIYKTGEDMANKKEISQFDSE